MRPLPLVLAMMGLASLGGDARAADRPGGNLCRSAGDASVRLGCYQRLLAKKVPGWEGLQHCAAERDANRQLSCFDEIAGVDTGGQRRLSAPYCAEIAAAEERLACFNERYAELLDKNDITYCFTLPQGDERLACFDRQHQPKEVQASKGYWTIQVREKGLPKAAALSEPASIGVVRSKGETHGQFKASLIARGRAFSPDGWYPFASLDINQDLTANTRSNTKSLGVGTSGILLDYLRTGVGVETVIQAKAKKDSELHTESAQLVIENQFVIRGLATGAPWAEQGSFQLYPVLGFSVEDWRKVKAGQPEGRATSGYIALEGVAWLPGQRRMQLNAVAQRFLDQSATGGLSKRFENYYAFGIDFYLFDPLKPPKTFTPVIGLKREIGRNPLESSVKLNRTAFLVRFKVDLVPY